MIDTGDLGKDVFFIDPKIKEVKEGVVSGINISQTGYVLISCFYNNKTAQLENKHIYLTKDAAEQRLIEINPLLASADLEIEKTKEKVDKLRIKVIGEPEYADLSKKITEGK